MGRGPTHLSAPPRNPLAHAASLRHCGLRAPDLCSGCNASCIAAGGRHRSVSPSPSVARTSRYAMKKVRKQLPALAALGGLLVARGATGLGAMCACRRSGGQWVHDMPPADGVLGPPGGSHALSPTESQDTGRPWKRCAPRLSGTPSPSGWPPTSWQRGNAWATDRVKRLSAHLVGRRRAQRLSVANASQSSGLAQAALQGVDSPA